MNRKTVAVFLSLAICACNVQAQADVSLPPTLYRHGVHYDSACTPASLGKLQQSLKALTVKAPDQAWKAIEVLLCGSGLQSERRYIASLLMPKVSRRVGGVEVDDSPDIVKSSTLTPDELFAKGVAFGAGIEDMPGELRIVYFADEACSASKTLRYVDKRWRLARLSHVCD